MPAMGIEEIRFGLAGRLRARQGEIEQAMLTRAQAVRDPREITDPEYTEGFRRSVSAALQYGIAALELGAERAPPIPTVLLCQARLAARNEVSLNTVLRRYCTGHTLLGSLLIEEANAEGDQAALQELLNSQAIVFDQLLVAISEEYALESSQGRVSSAEQRKAQQVQRLLDGELLDAPELAYDLNGHHLGLAVSGLGAEQAIRSLATELDRSLIVVSRGEGALWAWLGGRRGFDAEVYHHLSHHFSKQISLALGEPGQGICGWRLTHRQAKAALPIALRSQATCVRYGDVAILAAVLGDELFALSAQELYLAPLALERDGGKALRRTLRAYLATERNASSTAAAIGVSRQTVVNRLRLIEERLARPLASCVAEVDAALRLEELGFSAG
jgi:PucR C-terminal helix-turn-helix domain/GGDEF-like domain